MKAMVNIKKEVELNKIIVKAGVRYWNDCKYSENNGQIWRDGSKENDTDEVSEDFRNNLPFVEKGNIGYGEEYYWNIVIDINSGKVENWPKDFCISTWFKVCDDGLYQILDTDGEVVWDSIKSEYYYVPTFLEIGDEGYGDYIYLDIDGEGNIENWNEEGIPEIKEYFKEND